MHSNVAQSEEKVFCLFCPVKWSDLSRTTLYMSFENFQIIVSKVTFSYLTPWLTLELSDDCQYPASTCYSEPEKKVRFAVQDEIIEEIYEENFLVDDDIPYGKEHNIFVLLNH